MRGRAAADEGQGRLRRRAAWSGRIHQAAARDQGLDRAISRRPASRPCAICGEMQIEDSKDETKPGDRVLVDGFKIGEYVDVTGVSKGKGFQGGVKRWHYRGGDASHGSMFHRAPGGIGASSFPSRVWKGQHFPGTWETSAKRPRTLRVVKIDADENLLLVRGAVPGPAGSYIEIRKAKTAQSK